MKKKIAGYFNHPLISGSAIIFIGTFAANVLNFFYNIFMLNHLTRADYGTLASLVSIITLFALAIDSFTPTIVHFAATYFAKKEYDMVRGLFNTFTKGTSLLGIVIFFIFLLFSKQISYFFHIQEYSLIILTGIIVMFNIIFVVNRSMLQAQLAFTFMAIITLLGTILKLLIGILLIFSGLKVYGALLGFVLSFFIPFILSFFSLRIIFKEKAKKHVVSTAKIIAYSAPAALALLGVTFFISTDIIIVKHFFDPVLAGSYAGLSLMGKVIYFFSAPIGMVMFPLIVQKHSKNENYTNIFMLSLLLILLPSVGLTILYFLFPAFIIHIFNKQYLSMTPLLGIFALFISLYSILTILTNFFLSIKKTKVYIPIVTGAIFQAISLWFFHKDFLQVILLSIFSVAVPLAILFLYYWRLSSRVRLSVPAGIVSPPLSGGSQ